MYDYTAGYCQNSSKVSGQFVHDSKVNDFINYYSTSGAKTYDSLSDVAAAMSGSLAGVMDVFSPDSKRTGGQCCFCKIKSWQTNIKTTLQDCIEAAAEMWFFIFFLMCVCVCLLVETASYGRTINVAEGSRINIYILLDTSGSIKEKDFNASRNATITLINKVFYSFAFTLKSLSRTLSFNLGIFWEYFLQHCWIAVLCGETWVKVIWSLSVVFLLLSWTVMRCRFCTTFCPLQVCR